MGIYKLMSLIQEKAPQAINQNQIDKYQGRTVAVDASMAMYQFLISTQSYSQSEYSFYDLTDKDGNKTGHLVGLFYRSLTLLEHGIKPIWVFDGVPPEMKMEELQRRKQMKLEAAEQVEQKIEEGDMQQAAKLKQRTTYITKEMKEDAMKMIDLMGMTVVQAASEAEAQCALLCKEKKAFGVVSDDMDTLTFQSPILLRGFHNKKDPICEIDYSVMLHHFQMDFPQFLDLCILCGCDYTSTIDGIGPITAFKLIKEHKTLENVISHLQKENLREDRKKKFNIPQEFLDKYQMAREMFNNPNVHPVDQIFFKKGPPKPDEEKLIEFLVEHKGFNQARVEAGIKKIKAFQSKGAQSHLDSFFGKPVITKSTQKIQSKSVQKKGKK